MREILFRGKRVDNGEWIVGSLIIDERGNHYIGEYIKQRVESAYVCTKRRNGKTINRFIGIGFFMVISETVGQYTGLVDRNGKKIFEGDIVRMYFEGESSGYDEEGVSYNYDFYGHKIGVVSFGSNGTFINAKHGELHIDAEMVEGWTPTRRARLAGYRSEVIGNIHDNPELMEEAQE